MRKSNAENMRPYNTAITQLVNIYHAEYTEEYQRIKGDATGGRARSIADSRARSFIRNKYYAQYKQFVASAKECN